MKYAKRLAICLAAVLTLSTMTACGDNTSSGGDTNLEASSSVEQSSNHSSETDDDTDISSKEEVSSQAGNAVDSSSQADDTNSGTGDASTTADNSSAAPIQGDAPQGGSSGDGHRDESSQPDPVTPSGGGSAQTPTPNDPQIDSSSSSSTPASSNVPDESSDAPTVKETKYIYLRGDSAQYKGTGITVSGNRITISKGGTYQISGTLNGQIYVLAEDKKVTLQLAGCEITNSVGSAIFCQNAKHITIETMAGTTNNLTDGGTHDADKGTIFTEDTIRFEGEGTLNITANYAHGVQSDDDIFVNGGTINITSTKSGLHSNDGIEINGGTLFCDGGTNGIKTDGYIRINGGTSRLLGGTREEKGAIYCDGTFTYNGGTLYAVGNSCTIPDNATSTARVIGAMFSATQPQNTMVQFTSGGKTIASLTSPRSFRYALYAGDNLTANADYGVRYGETDGGSFRNDQMVTIYTVPLA